MSKTKADKLWLGDVSSLGCIACRNAGYGATPAEIHHVRSGSGMAQRAAHSRVLPLCPRHHRAWQQEHGSEEALLEQIIQEVAELRKNTTGRAA